MFGYRYIELQKSLISRRNVLLFFFILLPNIVASLLEGVSFAILLAALSLMSGEPSPRIQEGLVFLKSVGLFLTGFDWSQDFFALIILAILLQGVRSLIAGIALYTSSHLALRIQSEIQLKVFEKIFSLSFRSVSKFKVGELSEYTKMPAVIMNTVLDAANRVIVSIFMICVTLFLMSFLNLKLTILTGFLLIFVGLVNKKIMRTISHSSERLTYHVLDCSRNTVQFLQSIRTVFTFNKQEYVFDQIRTILRGIQRSSKTVHFLTNFVPSITELMGAVLLSAIILAASWLSERNQGALPALLTFLALTHRLSSRLQILNGAFSAIASHQGSLTKIDEILKDENKEFAPVGGANFSELERSLELKSVSLLYPSSGEYALKNVSLSIPKGATVAFVGFSGAGKSSLLDLILRLYEPTEGELLVDSVPLKQYSLGSWRNQLGVVSQDVAVFNDTIMENIRFGDSHSEERVRIAAKMAGLDHFVMSLPEKYETVVGERGVRLSGGQRQRLALARALIRDPKILVLDEATSSLDSYSEFVIQETLESLRKDRTILIVAHRLSTVMGADRIYVLRDGKIVEHGSHNQLLHKKGLYSELWDLQSEGRNQESLQRIECYKTEV